MGLFEVRAVDLYEGAKLLSLQGGSCRSAVSAPSSLPSAISCQKKLAEAVNKIYTCIVDTDEFQLFLRQAKQQANKTDEKTSPCTFNATGNTLSVKVYEQTFTVRDNNELTNKAHGIWLDHCQNHLHHNHQPHAVSTAPFAISTQTNYSTVAGVDFPSLHSTATCPNDTSSDDRGVSPLSSDTSSEKEPPPVSSTQSNPPRSASAPASIASSPMTSRSPDFSDAARIKSLQSLVTTQNRLIVSLQGRIDALKEQLASAPLSLNAAVIDQFSKLTKKLANVMQQRDGAKILIGNLTRQLTFAKHDATVSRRALERQNADLRTSQSLNQSLLADHTKLNAEITDLQQQLKTAEARIAELDTTVATAHNEKEQSVLQVQRLSTELAQLQQQLKSNQATASKAQNEIDRLTQAVESAQEKAAKLNNALTETQAALKVQTERAQTATAELVQITAARDDLQGQLKTAEGRIAELDTAVATAHNEKEQSAIQMQTLSTQLDQLQQQLKTAQAEITKLAQTAKSAEQQANELRKALTEKESVLQTQTERAQTATAELVQITAARDTLLGQLKTVQDEASQAQTEITELKQKAQSTQQQIEELTKALADKDAALKLAQTATINLAQMTAARDALEGQLKAANDATSTAQTALTQLTQAMTEKENEKTALAIELDAAKSTAADQAARISELLREIERLQAQIKKLEAQLAEALKQRTASETAKGAAEMALKRAQSEAATAAKRADEAQQQLAAKIKQLQEERASLEKAIQTSLNSMPGYRAGETSEEPLTILQRLERLQQAYAQALANFKSAAERDGATIRSLNITIKNHDITIKDQERRIKELELKIQNLHTEIEQLNKPLTETQKPAQLHANQRASIPASIASTSLSLPNSSSNGHAVMTNRPSSVPSQTSSQSAPQPDSNHKTTDSRKSQPKQGNDDLLTYFRNAIGNIDENSSLRKKILHNLPLLKYINSIDLVSNTSSLAKTNPFALSLSQSTPLTASSNTDQLVLKTTLNADTHPVANDQRTRHYFLSTITKTWGFSKPLLGDNFNRTVDDTCVPSGFKEQFPLIVQKLRTVFQSTGSFWSNEIFQFLADAESTFKIINSPDAPSAERNNLIFNTICKLLETSEDLGLNMTVANALLCAAATQKLTIINTTAFLATHGRITQLKTLLTRFYQAVKDPSATSSARRSAQQVSSSSMLTASLASAITKK